jgi:hypothetical protein
VDRERYGLPVHSGRERYQDAYHSSGVPLSGPSQALRQKDGLKGASRPVCAPSSARGSGARDLRPRRAGAGGRGGYRPIGGLSTGLTRYWT